MLPRLTRFFHGERLFKLLTMLLATFSQLDVVRNSELLDRIDDTRERREVEAQTQAFLNHVMHSILPVCATAHLKIIRGLVGVWMNHNDVVMAAQTRVRRREFILSPCAFF